MSTPATLDHAGIAARVPHHGRMCLLDRLERWSTEAIVCSATSHRDPSNPLRTASGLLAPCAIEYAGQAMALHGALLAPPQAAPTPGLLASARAVTCHVLRLDDVAGDLQVHAERLAGDARRVQYRFVLYRVDVGARPTQLLVEGRATVVLQPPGTALR